MDTLKKVLLDLSYLSLDNGIIEKKLEPSCCGSSCDIYSATSNRHNMKIAVKQFRVSVRKDASFPKKLAKEMRVWASLNHRNVLPLLGFFVEGSDGIPSLCAMWMERGTLHECMKKFPRGGRETYDMVRGIAEGLAYLHSQNVIHADLKSKNILISDDGLPMLADFGLSVVLPQSHGNSETNPRGTARWMARELLDFPSDETTTINEMIDVWAFGMVIYELLSWKLPYSQIEKEVLVISAISKGEVPEKPTDFGPSPKIFKALWTLCSSCWTKDPKCRPTASRIVQFLRSPVRSEHERKQTLMDGPRESLTEFQTRNPRGGNVWTLVVEDETYGATGHFDDTRPLFPSTDAFNKLAHAFKDGIGAQFTFLHWPSIFHAWQHQTISAGFANSLLALGFKRIHSDSASAANPFLNMAKRLIFSLIYKEYVPSVEFIHTLLLIAWAEYKIGRENAMYLCTSRALEIAVELGFHREAVIQTIPEEIDRDYARQTWWSVVLMNMITCWVTGNRLQRVLQEATIVVPTSSFLSSCAWIDSTHPYCVIREIIDLRDNITRLLGDFQLDDRIRFECARIGVRLAEMQDSLPPFLHLNAVNLKLAVDDRQAIIYVFLHLIINTLLAISYCPELLCSDANRPRRDVLVHPETLTAARNILDLLTAMDETDGGLPLSIPFLDLPLAIAARVFSFELDFEQRCALMLKDAPSVNHECSTTVAFVKINRFHKLFAKEWENTTNVVRVLHAGMLWSTASEVGSETELGIVRDIAVPVNLLPLAEVLDEAPIQSVDGYRKRKRDENPGFQIAPGSTYAMGTPSNERNAKKLKPSLVQNDLKFQNFLVDLEFWSMIRR